MNVRATRFPLMDSMRALAALCIVVGHAGFFAGIYEPGNDLAPFFANLDVGVAVFFVISGFLLYRPFVRARLHGEPWPATGPYAWRRFLRIVPAYWVALTIITIWLGTREVFTAEGIATYYGFGQTLRTDTIGGGLPQAWTLCVEIAFYAFLPLYAFVMRRGPGRGWRGGLRAEAVGILALIVASGIWKLAVLASANPDAVGASPTLTSLPTFLDQFAIGMGLAVASVALERPDADPRALLERFVVLVERVPWACWLVGLLAFVAAATLLDITGEFFRLLNRRQWGIRHLLFGIVALGLLLPVVFGDPRRGALRRTLGLRPLLWLGLVSYGVYLWHVAVFTQLARWDFGSLDVLPQEIRWPLAGALGATAIAAASYYTVERPVLSLKRLFGEQPRSAAGEAVAEPAPVAPPAPASRGG